MFTACAFMMQEASGYGIKICLRLFIKLNSFLSDFSQYWSFLIFGDVRVEFLVSSFFLVDGET